MFDIKNKEEFILGYKINLNKCDIIRGFGAQEYKYNTIVNQFIIEKIEKDPKYMK